MVPTPPDDRSWKDFRHGVTYPSRRHPRFHRFFESYQTTNPDQPNRRLVDTYYAADVPDMPAEGIESWRGDPHRGFVLEAQWIREGWIQEIAEPRTTPDLDLSKLGITPLERARGVIAGLAIGDALGRPVEFWSRAEIEDEYGFLDSFEGGGTHGQPPGTVSDDTEQALCIATSLASCGEWSPEAVADQFVDWYESGPFDIGTTTSRSMKNLAVGMEWDEAGKATRRTFRGDRATNGSIMRCAPLAIAYPYETEQLVQYSRESSIITHAHPRCAYGAAILNLTIANILTYTEDPLASALDTVADDAPDELVSRLSSIEAADETALSSSGDVTDTLETALYYALTSSTFFEAVTNAVNTGGDTDTVGAVAGAVAGARFGFVPTLDRHEPAGIDFQLLKAGISDFRQLVDYLHELEDGIGTFPKEWTWRDYIPAVQS